MSRSARDIVALAEELLEEAAQRRPLLRLVREGREAPETAIDAERRELIRANERRLESYLAAARAWRDAWPAIAAEVAGLPVRRAHALIVGRAQSVLPFGPGATTP